MKNRKQSQFHIFLVYAGFAYMVLDQNLMTLILSDKKAYDVSYISFLELVLQFGTIILEIPTGIVGDFVSKKVLLLGARLSYVSYGIIFLVTDNLYMMILAFILLGVSESLISGTEESIVAEIDEEKQVKKYMYFSTIVQISTVVSILLGGVLYMLTLHFSSTKSFILD